MSYLVRAYYSISPTRYYKDDSCWSADLKSNTTEDVISIGSFMEVLVLNHYVLVRKLLNTKMNILTIPFPIPPEDEPYYYISLKGISVGETRLLVTKSDFTINISGDGGTDKANITRKRSKPDKHGHGNGKECTRAGRMLSKSTIGQLQEDKNPKNPQNSPHC
ncbi:ribonuclease H-like domain-containing protein [Tanacetum coccineum]